MVLKRGKNARVFVTAGTNAEALPAADIANKDVRATRFHLMNDFIEFRWARVGWGCDRLR